MKYGFRYVCGCCGCKFRKKTDLAKHHKAHDKLAIKQLEGEE